MSYKKKYGLPPDVYGISIRIIRAYYKNRAEVEAMIVESPTNDGQPKGTGVGDPVGNIAAKRERLRDKVEAVEWALNKIPEEYREALMNNICFNQRFPEFAHLNTWKHYKSMLVWNVAFKMGDI